MKNYFESLIHLEMGLENLAMAEIGGCDDTIKAICLEEDIKRIKEQAAKQAEDTDC